MPASPLTTPDVEVDYAQRTRVRLLQLCCVIISISQVSNLTISVVLQLSGSPTTVISSLLSNLISAPVLFTIYRLATTHYYKLMAWLLLVLAMVGITAGYYEYGTRVPLVTFFLVAIVLAAILLEIWGALVIAVYAVVATASIYLAEFFFHYTPLVVIDARQVIIISLVFTFVPVVVVVLLVLIPAREQTRVLLTQNHRLRSVLNENETRQKLSAAVSQQVLALSTQLKTSADEQNVGSQEQVTALSEISSALTELSSTARNIAHLTEQIKAASLAVVEDSGKIQETTSLSAAQSALGSEAIAATIRVSNGVTRLYQQLTKSLNELSGKNANMRRILELISSIAAETHLLSLNAAIEAAGAGVYGERFSVIAQEVKDLAGRSAAAGREVFQIVQEIERTTATSVDAVDLGYQEARQLERVAGEAGAVITQMREVAVQAQSQAVLINQTAYFVQNLSATINEATHQQESASQQVLGVLGEVSHIANQNADNSVLVSATAQSLEETATVLVK